MSFDKAKAMRNAERFLAQGKIRAAINEYKRVVETDKTDYNTLNMLGDLYAKASEPDEAVVCFTQVAEHYGKQGFAQKAIAIYNKISRLKPDSLEVSEKLARLYQMKGSVAEAKLHYTTVAEQYSKTGKKAEALGIWKQIADLDPTSTDVYLKIADACWHEKQEDEAADAYTEAGKRLTAKLQFESATAAFSRALEVRPDDLPALRGYVEVQSELGYSAEAALKVEKALEKQPYNRDLIELLIDCYLAGGDLLEAERVTYKLMEQDPTSYPRLLDLMKAYLAANNSDAATRTLSTASEHLLVAGRAEELGNHLDEILMRNPEQLDAIRTLVRLKTWLRDERGISDTLARLAEAARSAGATEDERYAIAQLVLIAPQNAHYAQRWQEIKDGYGSDEYLPESYNSGTEAVPTFESFTALGDEDLVSSSQSTFSYPDDSEYTESNVGAEYQSSVPVTFLPPEDQLNSGFRFADESPSGLNYSAPANQWSENGAEVQEIASADIIENVEISEKDIQSIQELFDATSEERNLNAANTHDLSEFERHNLEQELEGVEFYVGQGFADLALKTLDEIETRYGRRPEIETARVRLSNNGTEPVDTSGNGFSSDESESDDHLKSEPASEHSVFSSFADQTVSEFATSGDFSSQFPVSQELENLSSTYAETGTMMESHYSETPFSSNLSQNGNGHDNDYSFLDDAVEVTNVTYVDDPEPEPEPKVEESEPIEQVSEDTAHLNFAPAETESEQFETPPAQVEEDDAVEIQAATPATAQEDTENDFETRYQTGVAYKEMGLLEDSIREGQVCFKLLPRDDRSKNYYQACLLLADCFMEKQMPSIAVMWYKRAQEATGLNEDELQGLCYELANAYERAGDTQNAKLNFESIYAMDVDYRDVSQRLMNLM